MIIVWTPNRTTISADQFLQIGSDMAYDAGEPLSDPVLEMLADISRAVLQDAELKAGQQYVALSYWLRKAALTRLVADLQKQTEGNFIPTCRGVALHLPPTNVDTIFVYSWALSVLAGNANIVRLSEHLSPSTERLVEVIAGVVAAHGQADRQIFCTYKYDSDIERQISALCDLRMIWGGDAKVEAVSKVSIRPDGLSIGFPDRKSLSIISAKAYFNAADEVRDALAAQFYNDMYWFDQMACGSPRLLAWLGDSTPVADDFYARLRKVISDRQYVVDVGAAIGKIALGNDLLAEGRSVYQSMFDNGLTINRLVDPKSAFSKTHGAGFLCEWTVAELGELRSLMIRSVQTITYFGFNQEDCRRIGKLIAGRGGYRIVPVGQALQFGPIWDGVDLFSHMTRKIVIS